MTRFRIGVVMLIALLAAGIWSQQQVAQIQEPIALAMEDASRQALLGHWEAAAQAAAEAETAWQEHRVFTAAIADHNPMDEIESLLAQLPALAAVHNRSAYAAVCSNLSRRLHSMSEAHRLDWGSLF